jgi:Protein of unknown function (DUF3102)
MNLEKFQPMLSERTELLSSPEKKNFDYNSLSSEVKTIVEKHTTEIRSLIRRTAQDTIEIGRKLNEVKHKLAHGKFEAWLEAEFDWGPWTARKFINIARKFKSVNFTDLSVSTSALYLLASSSTPEYVCNEVLERAAQGETISYTKAKTLITQLQEETKSPVSKAPEQVNVVVDAKIKDSSHSSTQYPELQDVTFQSVTELFNDKLPKEQETVAYLQVANLLDEKDLDIEKSDYLLEEQINEDIESPFFVGDLMYLNDSRQQEFKLLGQVSEVKKISSTEVVVKISLQISEVEVEGLNLGVTSG